jgi:hypothetical protein
MQAALRQIHSGIAAAAFRIADAAPNLVLLGPLATLAALLTAWLAGPHRAPAA